MHRLEVLKHKQTCVPWQAHTVTRTILDRTHVVCNFGYSFLRGRRLGVVVDQLQLLQLGRLRDLGVASAVHPLLVRRCVEVRDVLKINQCAGQ